VSITQRQGAMVERNSFIFIMWLSKSRFYQNCKMLFKYKDYSSLHCSDGIYWVSICVRVHAKCLFDTIQKTLMQYIWIIKHGDKMNSLDLTTQLKKHSSFVSLDLLCSPLCSHFPYLIYLPLYFVQSSHCLACCLTRCKGTTNIWWISTCECRWQWQRDEDRDDDVDEVVTMTLHGASSILTNTLQGSLYYYIK
jgi:hypothetical protein